MKSLIFNIHDLVLVIVTSLCGLMALLSTGQSRLLSHSSNLLTAFFVINAMIAFDTLAFWGDNVKYAVFEVSPWLLMVFSFATFAFGPILYWLIHTEITEEAPSRTKLILHLLPALCTPIYLYWACYRFPLDIQRDLILNLDVYSLPAAHFSTFVSLKKLSPVIYGGLCLYLFWRIPREKLLASSNIKHLLYLTLGFTLVRAWVLLAHFFGSHLPETSSDFMGIVGNYMTLGLLLGLVIFAIRSHKPSQNETGLTNTPKPGLPEEKLKAEILTLMVETKPYLNPRFSLEKCAELMSLSPRQVSTAINKCFGQNFQQFVNLYRVEEAKRLLTESQQLSIWEVTQQSGFNSKATFNRFFKTQVGMSPSEYRQLAVQNANPIHI